MMRPPIASCIRLDTVAGSVSVTLPLGGAGAGEPAVPTRCEDLIGTSLLCVRSAHTMLPMTGYVLADVGPVREDFGPLPPPAFLRA